MTDSIELYRQALLIMVSGFVVVFGTLIAVVTWNARRVIASVDELKRSQSETIAGLKETLQVEMRVFDRRLTRVETIARVRSEDVARDIDEARRGS